jgi:hypothetical protein
MRSEMLGVVALAVLAGCRIEGGDQARAERQRAAQDTTAEAGEGRAPIGHRVFNRKSEQVAPGIVRVTVSTIVRIEVGQDSARKTIENLLEQERRRDSSVAAIRVLAYLPPAEGHGAQQSALVPLAFLDWVPAAGWDHLTPETVRQPYRATTTFVHDAATMGMAGAGGGRPAPPPGSRSPHGQMPPMPPRQPQ